MRSIASDAPSVLEGGFLQRQRVFIGADTTVCGDCLSEIRSAVPIIAPS